MHQLLSMMRYSRSFSSFAFATLNASAPRIASREDKWKLHFNIKYEGTVSKESVLVFIVAAIKPFIATRLNILSYHTYIEKPTCKSASNFISFRRTLNTCKHIKKEGGN